MATKLKLNLRSAREDLSLALRGSFVLNRKIDREIIAPVTQRTENVVRETFEAAVQNVKDVMKGGVGDSTSPLHHIGIATGGGTGSLLLPGGGWSPLSEDYDRRKRREMKGAGVYHRYRGGMYSAFSGMRKTPLVTATQDRLKETSPGKGRKRNIEFRVKVLAGSLRFPLDELVRRPLLLGRKGLVDPGTVTGDGSDGQMKLLGLESGIVRYTKTGTLSYQPPRPFLGAMAVKLNSRMRQRILQQDSKE